MAWFHFQFISSCPGLSGTERGLGLGGGRDGPACTVVEHSLLAGVMQSAPRVKMS